MDKESVALIDDLRKRFYLPSFLPIVEARLNCAHDQFFTLEVTMHLPSKPKASWEDVIAMAKLVPDPTWPDVMKLAAALNLPEETKE
jgi:hypothetical protein